MMKFNPPLPLSVNEDEIVDYLSDRGFGDFVTLHSVQFVEEDTHVTFNDASVIPNVIRNIKGTLLQGQYKVVAAYVMASGPPPSPGKPMFSPAKPKSVPAKPMSYSQAVSSHATKAGYGSGYPTTSSQSKKTTALSVVQRHPPVPRPAVPQQQAAVAQPVQSFPGVPATAKRVPPEPSPDQKELSSEHMGEREGRGKGGKGKTFLLPGPSKGR